MASRNQITKRYVINGKPVIISLINNPVIDDILVTEARIQASYVQTGNVDPNRRVDRGLRDFLIRLGVQR